VAQPEQFVICSAELAKHFVIIIVVVAEPGPDISHSIRSDLVRSSN